jgi:hypothetical protein
MRFLALPAPVRCTPHPDGIFWEYDWRTQVRDSRVSSNETKPNETSVFCHDGLLILPHSSGSVTSMKAMFIILVLALIAITFELYSDASLTSAEFSHPSVPDPASAAIAHGLKHG